MPAPFIENVFQFDRIAAALAAALNADALLANICYADPTARDLPKSRIDVTAENFVKASEQQVYAGGRFWDSHFAGDITLALIHQRGDTANANLRSPRLGRLHYLMSPKAQIFTSSNLPYWEVLSLDRIGNPTLQPGDNSDRTEILFRCEIAVLASAFPAVIG